MTRVVLLLCAGLSVQAQDFKGLEQKVTDFTLPNGLRFIVAERHDAPVVSFVTYVAAGVANDSPGRTGLAAFFERLAFKGTDSIGTRDAAAEKKALDAVEEALDQLDAERAKGRQANDINIVRLEMEAQKAIALAQSYARINELQDVLEENCATGLAARVTADSTQMQVALPANRAELWFALESQRITRPVFRDFYRERDAAAPDFRGRVEQNPQIKLLQTLASVAFAEHPYRNPAMGWPAEFAQLRHSDARQFFNRYWVPANITIGIAGDIRPDEARRLAEKYFGPIAARPLPPPSRVEEPPQTGPRSAVIENSLQPLLAVGFKRPEQTDREAPALEVLRAILAGGRSALLARELIDTRRSAATVSVLESFPGSRAPHLFTIVVTPAAGRTAEENEKSVSAVLARLQTEPVEEATLAAAKAQIRLSLVRRLADNASIAGTLAAYAAEFGDWRRALAAPDAIAKVTATQVQIAAAKYFVPSRRTTVMTVQPAPLPAARPKGAAN